MPVGTPEMVADLMEEWIDIADVDGKFRWLVKIYNIG
jgi:alkanesulfonate monooxygenase SsuD/methylene tetrahydromethanopterin reductase-like flavin-dependent oxidoreductase (luciferase family)